MKLILGALEMAWANITKRKVKDAYKAAYETAIERLSDPDYYPPKA